MIDVPPDVVAHCASFRLCKGCPLRTCEAPTYPASDPRWSEWLAQRMATIRTVTIARIEEET